MAASEMDRAYTKIIVARVPPKLVLQPIMFNW